MLPHSVLSVEGKRENYQVCSICAILCATIVHNAMDTNTRIHTTVLWIGFCLTGPILLCLDSFLYVLCIIVYCMHVSVCNMVRWT